MTEENLSGYEKDTKENRIKQWRQSSDDIWAPGSPALLTVGPTFDF